jgi:hypothetical protein
MMADEQLAKASVSADLLITELRGGSFVKPPSTGTSMGRLQKCSYTHEAMIDLIIKNPEMSQNQLAAHFGYTPGWISNVLASDAFQALMASRREEIIDPELKASIEERFRALVIQSLKVLSEKLNKVNPSDNVALRAAELGAKALGVGGHAPPPPAPPSDRLARLAERLVSLQSNIRERVLNAEDVKFEELPRKVAG